MFLGFLLIVATLSCCIGHTLDSADKERWMHPGHQKQKGVGRIQEGVEDAEHWVRDAQKELDAGLKKQPILKKAKNILFYLGDGMSVPTVTAARILKGQTIDGLKFGEEGELYMDTLPFTGYSRTFCSDAQVADSACSATAYLCGSKGNDATIGVTPTVTYRSCVEQAKENNHVHSLLKWAQDAGMSTGIITTTRITHASPAGTFAHIASRDWENDERIERDVPGGSKMCDDIAKQLILNSPGKDVNVILGGGRNQFTTTDAQDPEYENLLGYRTDGENLIQRWIDGKNQTNSKYITKRSELFNIKADETDFLFGLFEPDHLLYLDEIVAGNKDDPTLEEMVEKAIQILSKNEKGFFVFIEGGKIDHGHHANQVQRALVEAIEFDKAIKKGDDMTNDEDTLIIVTADHAHVMHIAGYPTRGNPILGHVRTDSGPTLARDGLPYSTLGYGNGPGYYNYNNDTVDGRAGWLDPESNSGTRRNITDDDFKNPNYVVAAAVPLGEFGETHGGDDVPIFAKGPYAHLLTGSHQQSFIPHVAMYAACIGPTDRKNHCTVNPIENKSAVLRVEFQLFMILSTISTYFISM